MFDLILIFFGALMLAAAASAWLPAIRNALVRLRYWIRIAAVASIFSLASAAHSTRRHSGTGWKTSFGWPKPWYGRWESLEDGSGSSSASLLYFAGNTLFYAAVLIAIWLLWRLAADIGTSNRGAEG